MATLILFMNLDYDILFKMIDYGGLISYFIILPYIFIAFVILENMLFVIFLDAYNKVRKRHVLTLLKYSIIFDGLIQFSLNMAIKIATIFRIRNLVLKIFQK